jgi:hypothetical protein
MPTAFTPNGDGINDIYIASGITSPSFHMKFLVAGRNGFESSDMTLVGMDVIRRPV